jgi:hypothetical protein
MKSKLKKYKVFLAGDHFCWVVKASSKRDAVKRVKNHEGSILCQAIRPINARSSAELYREVL